RISSFLRLAGRQQGRSRNSKQNTAGGRFEHGILLNCSDEISFRHLNLFTGFNVAQPPVSGQIQHVFPHKRQLRQTYFYSIYFQAIVKTAQEIPTQGFTRFFLAL
ncbi:hypothetical protein, partial [Neisseria dentiae]|uniref:hypothetical protein n=1 Tax=Neisseria dentiae TaxID=194197 RepID=UPI0035A0BBFF